MSYEEKNITKMQNIILENRNNLIVSGVIDVLNFDEQLVTLDTELRNIGSKRRWFKVK